MEPEENTSIPQKRPSKSLWARMGGGSLMLATLFHVVLMISGGFWIFQVIREPEKNVDFLPPGGGGGERGAESQIQKKKQAQITPVTSVNRVFAEGAVSNYAIPEQGDNFGEMSSLASLGGGGMSGGLGGSGSGKGFGKGSGNAGGLGGGGGGLGIKLFGMDLKVKSIGVVLDVSGSMTPHLKRVLDEIDQVAEGSPVVLHVGCGISDGRAKKRIEPVSAPRDGFKQFWYLSHDDLYRSQMKNPKTKVDFTRPVPSSEVYEMLEKRAKTYYYEIEGTRTTGDALLAPEFKNVEAVYWFADFQDAIDTDEAEKVQRALKRRNQKLFIHASAKGQFLDVARDQIAKPTGGGELKAPPKI